MDVGVDHSVLRVAHGDAYTGVVHRRIHREVAGQVANAHAVVGCVFGLIHSHGQCGLASALRGVGNDGEQGAAHIHHVTQGVQERGNQRVGTSGVARGIPGLRMGHRCASSHCTQVVRRKSGNLHPSGVVDAQHQRQHCWCRAKVEH